MTPLDVVMVLATFCLGIFLGGLVATRIFTKTIRNMARRGEIFIHERNKRD